MTADATPEAWKGVDRRTAAALGDGTLRATYLSGVVTGHEEAADAIVAWVERRAGAMGENYRAGALAAAEVARGE